MAFFGLAGALSKEMDDEEAGKKEASAA